MAARADPAGFGEAVPFSRAALLAAAEALAGEAFDDRRDQVPEPLRALSYNAYRAIRPGPGFPAPLSEDGGFLYETMPAGFVFAQPVDIHVVEGDMARPLLAFRERHIFDPPASDVIPEDLLEVPFSGFRLRSPINAGDVFDEFAVFQGASYFLAA
ncbi:MAG: glucan biosynthesis protein [Pseudomonadota bacterium]